MTDLHPITPPPELVAQWFLGARAMPVDQWVTDVAAQAANWGADQELEACCEWAAEQDRGFDHELRAARRPKPPSLAEQKQAILAEIHQLLAQISANNAGALAVAEPIRHALERLQELEGQGDG